MILRDGNSALSQQISTNVMHCDIIPAHKSRIQYYHLSFSYLEIKLD